MPVKTLDIDHMGETSSNRYEKIVVMSKRARQIAAQEKLELDEKLKYFEGFEEEDEFTFNEEQENISKAFEKLPHATQRAVDEQRRHSASADGANVVHELCATEPAAARWWVEREVDALRLRLVDPLVVDQHPVDARAHDADEHERGRDRPDDLEPRVPVDLGSLGVLGHPASPAKTDDEEDESRLDRDEDDGADREDDPVEPGDGLAAVGLRRRRADSAGRCERKIENTSMRFSNMPVSTFRLRCRRRRRTRWNR